MRAEPSDEKRRMKGRWYILLAAWVGSMLATLPAQGQDEEENTYGRDLVVQRCSECHTLKRVFRANYDRSGWSDATGRMMDQGLMVEEEERAAIIDFLLSQKEQRPLLEQVGMLHFVLIHLPIALLLVVGLFEGLALWRRERLIADHTHLLLSLAAVSVVGTIVLGFALIFEWRTLSPALVLHRNFGLATGGLTILALILRQVAVKKGLSWAIWAYRGILVLAMIAVALTADRGGTIIHGDLAREIAQSVLGAG